jgi:tetratricopeptide (TPR) repeat protein
MARGKETLLILIPYLPEIHCQNQTVSIMSSKTRLLLNPVFLIVTPFLLIKSLNAQVGYSKEKLAEYYQKQDYEEAVSFLKSIESQNETVISFNTDIGYALFMNEQLDEAKLYFQKAFLQQPENFQSTLYLAQIWSAKNNWDSSLFYYNILLKNYPNNYRFWQRAGGLNYQLGNFDSSLYYYRRAFSLNNHSGRIAVSIANLLIRSKNVDVADSLLSDFLKRDSSDEDVIAKRIEINFKKSMYDTVIRWGEKLWRDSSQLSAPFVSLAYSYLNKQLYPTCIQLCDWLEYGDKANESILYCHALAFAKMELYEESNAKLDECIKMSIQDDAHTYLAAKADNYENMKIFTKATQYYDTAWYIFHKPYDLYFAGRIYDKYLKNSAKTTYYYRLFNKNKPQPKSNGESRVIEYVDGYLKEKQRALKSNTSKK